MTRTSNLPVIPNEPVPVMSMVLSLGVQEKEWHQRTGIALIGEGSYRLYPGHPDKGQPTDIQFVPRPYKSDNAPVGVTPEALLAVVEHYLQRPFDLHQPPARSTLADSNVKLALHHIERAIDALHNQTP